MNHLIDTQTQAIIAAQIDAAVEIVLGELSAHGNEEALTSALGHALMRQSFRNSELKVEFRYRQHNKITEEPSSGADGGFIVRVVTLAGSVEKVALFQAKLLGGFDDVRTLKMSKADAVRLNRQVGDMLRHTNEAVAMFYTWRNIYVVDASDYRNERPFGPQAPLAESHRLLTLGTYLGKWLPRCTKGDIGPELVARVKHLDGFKRGLTLDVVSLKPAVSWERDAAEDAWRYRGRNQRR